MQTRFYFRLDIAASMKFYLLSLHDALPILVVGIMAFAPSAFADQSVTIASGAGSSANAACVSTHEYFRQIPINVAPGDTVTWKNTDTASHTVTSGKPDNSTGNIVAAVFDSS